MLPEVDLVVKADLFTNFYKTTTTFNNSKSIFTVTLLIHAHVYQATSGQVLGLLQSTTRLARPSTDFNRSKYGSNIAKLHMKCYLKVVNPKSAKD